MMLINNLLMTLIVYLFLMLKLKVVMNMLMIMIRMMLIIRKKVKKNLKNLLNIKNMIKKILLLGSMVKKENLGCKKLCIFLVSLSKVKKKNIIINFVNGWNLSSCKFLWLMLLNSLLIPNIWKILLLIRGKFLMRKFPLCLLIIPSMVKFLRSLETQYTYHSLLYQK